MERTINGHPVQRNELDAAYQHAEALYDNAVALSQFLDAWSKRDRAPDFGPESADHVFNHLQEAMINLDALIITLTPFLPPMGEMGETNEPIR